MTNWALILGASSGIGAECALELAKKGINIYGLYLRKPANHISMLTNKIQSLGVQVIYKKINAANEQSRNKIINDLSKKKNIHIKVMVHSLAFGALQPMIGNNISSILNQKNKYYHVICMIN